MTARLVLASRCPGGLAGVGGACSEEHACRSLRVTAHAALRGWGARRWKRRTRFVGALVFDLPESLCQERNRSRADRNFGPHVIRSQRQALRSSLRGLQREGFRHVTVFPSVEEVDAARLVREPLWNNKEGESGPLDIIGDVHGCCDELHELLLSLGYLVDMSGDRPCVTHSQGRKAVFVGDLVDRGPKTPEVLKLVMGSVAAGTAYCVAGNHDVKLAHAGLREEMHGRGSAAVRAFAMYGETTGSSTPVVFLAES